jgi:hypothetical protein
MTSAASERLRELAAVATKLGDLIDGERPDALLPFVALARATVVADKAASELEQLLGMLTQSQPDAGTAPATRKGEDRD